MYIRPGLVVVIVGATLTGVSTLVVGLRYYCRHFIMRSLGASDHLMLVALISSWGMFIVNYYQDQSSGKYRPSQLRNPAKRPMIEASVRSNLISWWIYRLGYPIALGFVKLSILFFYRAIASHKTFRRLVNTTICFVCLYTFSTTIASIFQCEKPSDSWNTTGFFNQFDRDPSTKRLKLKCYDPVKLWVFSAAVNLLTDVIILLLPIPALLSLRVPMSKRLALIGIFSIGIMAIVASSIRVWVMMLWAASPWNSARYGSDMLLWGQVETNSGIISASVPFVRMLFCSRRKDERAVPERKVPASPPQDMGEAGFNFNLEQPREKPLEFGMIDIEKQPGEGSPGWKPFITVPKSLHSGSRGSAMLEPIMYPSTMLEPVQYPHSTV